MKVVVNKPEFISHIFSWCGGAWTIFCYQQGGWWLIGIPAWIVVIPLVEVNVIKLVEEGGP